MTYQDAIEKALAEWEAVRHVTKVQLVEEGTDQIIAQLQQEKYVVMGLTTQGLSLATRTVQQLASLQIDLLKTAPSRQDQYFISEHGVLYRHGLLFTSGTPKGEALLKLLNRINLTIIDRKNAKRLTRYTQTSHPTSPIEEHDTDERCNLHNGNIYLSSIGLTNLHLSAADKANPFNRTRLFSFPSSSSWSEVAMGR